MENKANEKTFTKFSEMVCISRDNPSIMNGKNIDLGSEKYGSLESKNNSWPLWHNPGDSVDQDSVEEMPWKHILQRVKNSKVTSGCSHE